MQVVRIEKVEDCFDGSSVYQYFLDESWTRDRIVQLSALGRLEYFPEFPRPFFRVLGSTGYQLKGIEGESYCRVILPNMGKDEAHKTLMNFLNDRNVTIHSLDSIET